MVMMKPLPRARGITTMGEDFRISGAAVFEAGSPALIGFGLDLAKASRHKRQKRRGILMKKFLLQLFTWWNGQTLGTRFHTWKKGARVGEDEAGNVYYQGGQDSEGRTRRWVIYNGQSEASSIPSGWHGWIHHRTDVSPAQENYQPRDWQMPHEPNQTGTSKSYRPKGSMARGGDRPKATGDYDAWMPRS